jgi:hypothetical protein
MLWGSDDGIFNESISRESSMDFAELKSAGKGAKGFLMMPPENIVSSF